MKSTPRNLNQQYTEAAAATKSSLKKWSRGFYKLFLAFSTFPRSSSEMLAYFLKALNESRHFLAHVIVVQ